MDKIKLIIFDLDGTLADTSSGIYQCHCYTLLKLRGRVLTQKDLDGVIGGPLLKTYIERFGFSQDEAANAVKIYRDYYSTEGKKGAVLYPGMRKTLIELRKRNYLTAVATLKEESLAKFILRELEIDDLFDLIHGMDAEDTYSKSDIVNICMNEMRCTPQQTVLVGDSKHDAEGAMKANVGFIGCTYGFGFSSNDSVLEYDPIAVINKPADILKIMQNDISRK